MSAKLWRPVVDTLGWQLVILLACTTAVRAGEIHDAIRINDLTKVKALIAKDRMLVHARDDDRCTPLHEAVRYGDVAMVEFLISQGADVNARCYNEFAPLHLTDDPEIAKVLIKGGADIAARSVFGTPLDDAIQDENLELVELYLSRGQKLNFEQLVELGRTKEVGAILQEKPWLAKAPRKCLHIAAGSGNLELSRLLLDHGADPNLDYGFANVSGVYSPLSNAVQGGHYEIARLLCERGATMNVAGGKMYDSLFHNAVAQRDIRFVRLMLEHGANVDAQNHFPPLTPLHVAANIGDVEKCKLLLEFKADVNAQTPDGKTPLFVAAVWNHAAVCDLLLAEGAKLDVHTACMLGKGAELRRFLDTDATLANAKDPLGRTPLFWAARHGRTELVALLISRGANVNALAPSYFQAGNVVTGPEVHASDRGKVIGETPLLLAAGAGHVDVVRLLLGAEAKMDMMAEYNRTPLSMAVAGGHVAVVKLLLEHKAPVDPNPGANSPLTSAYENLEMARLLLSHKPSRASMEATLRLAADDHPDVSKLMLDSGAEADFYTACVLGMAERVAALIKADPRLIEREQSEYPRLKPLVLAAKHGHVLLVKLLLDRGATLQPPGFSMALQTAAQSGHGEVVELLLARGADINCKDAMGQTALHEAAEGGQLGIVKLLLARGANPLLTDVYRHTALHDAARTGSVEIAGALIAAGIAVDCRDDFRETPLHEAASSGRKEVAALLLDKGADVNAKNRRGKTPLWNADREIDRIFGQEEGDRKGVGELLRRHGGFK
jgi:ankyrin